MKNRISIWMLTCLLSGPAMVAATSMFQVGLPVLSTQSEQIQAVSPSYSSVSKGRVTAIINSHGRLEISVREGSAAKKLKAKVGQSVLVRF